MHSAKSLILLGLTAALILVGAMAALLRTEIVVPEPPPARPVAAAARAVPAPMPEFRAPSLAQSAPLTPATAALAGRTTGASSPAPSAGVSPVCSVHGSVLDHSGQGVAALTVKLYRGRDEQQVETDAQGRYAFAGLQRGLYRLCVDSASLPQGMRLLPSWKQQPDQRDDGDAAGMLGTTFRLTDGADPEVMLRVFRAGSVRGRLIDVQRQPIVNALIAIHTADGIQDAAKTDVAGRFVFDEAYPGDYATSVDLSRSLAGDASSPPPVQFELAPGGAVVLDDLVAGIGGHILRGAVVDLAGQPVAGLGVLCQEDTDALYRLRWKVVTDVHGRFEIGRVPSSPLVVCVGPDDRDLPRETRLLAENVAPIRVDTRDASETIELGAIRVQARHPFQVRGRVQIDRVWAVRRGTGWTPRVEVRERNQTTARALEVVPMADLFPDLSGSVVSCNFTWSSATPHPEVEFRAVLTDRDGLEQARLATITPSADGTQDLLFSFP